MLQFHNWTQICRLFKGFKRLFNNAWMRLVGRHFICCSKVEHERCTPRICNSKQSLENQNIITITTTTIRASVRRSRERTRRAQLIQSGRWVCRTGRGTQKACERRPWSAPTTGGEREARIPLETDGIKHRTQGGLFKQRQPSNIKRGAVRPTAGRDPTIRSYVAESHKQTATAALRPPPSLWGWRQVLVLPSPSIWYSHSVGLIVTGSSERRGIFPPGVILLR